MAKPPTLGTWRSADQPEIGMASPWLSGSTSSASVSSVASTRMTSLIAPASAAPPISGSSAATRPSTARRIRRCGMSWPWRRRLASRSRTCSRRSGLIFEAESESKLGDPTNFFSPHKLARPSSPQLLVVAIHKSCEKPHNQAQIVARFEVRLPTRTTPDLGCPPWCPLAPIGWAHQQLTSTSACGGERVMSSARSTTHARVVAW
mgnify:CR=1 FL=1|jgi:hypothetical protein